jgi:DNA-binding MarR family transcriptional regulator
MDDKCKSKARIKGLAMPAIKGFPGRDCVTVGELAERLRLRHHCVVGLIDRLVAEKLVVSSTSRAEKILEKLSALHQEQLQRVGPEISLLLGWLNDGGAGGKEAQS